MGNPVKTRQTKERPLSKNMEAFAVAWTDLGNGLQAYRRAYPLAKMNDDTAMSEAARLLADPRVITRVQDLRKPAANLATMTFAEWIAYEIDVGYSDPTELVKYRVLNCRHCRGLDHKYQWRNMAEYGRAVEQWLAEDAKRKPDEPPARPMPDAEGGYGFRSNLLVEPGCPVCEGEGVREVFIEDSAKLSRQAKRLLAGYKVGKYGIEVLMHDQTAARVNVAKALQYLVDRTKHEGTLGIAATPLSLTPEQAAAIADKLMGEI